jgi:hypothetical protein
LTPDHFPPAVSFLSINLKNINRRLGMVVYTSNFSMWEAETGGSQVLDQMGYIASSW